MDISVITVTWNSAEYIAAQIASVRAQLGDLSYEQIIVDNASADDTAKIASGLDVTLIQNTDNAGFSAANNQGFAVAKGKYVLFLNPDMELTSSVQPMIDLLEREQDVAIVGGQLVGTDGQPHLEAVPRRQPRVSELAVWLLKWQRLMPRLHARHMYRDADFSTRQDVESVRGSFMLVRKSFLLELGFAFDPRYYIWFEDLDLCREALTRKQRVVFEPAVTAIDLVGQSFSQRRKLWRGRQFTRSMLTYARKWEPRYKTLLLEPLRLFSIMLSAIGG